jgi:hypothetical protein
MKKLSDVSGFNDIWLINVSKAMVEIPDFRAFSLEHPGFGKRCLNSLKLLQSWLQEGIAS